jgi:cyclic beta-1,2-glucan synthetase
VLKLRNVSGRPRRISVTGYWEWVLGDLRAKSLLHVQTEVDLKTGALLARNFYSTDFAGRIVFLDVNDPARTSPATAEGIHRAQRQPGPAGRAAAGAPLRQGRRGPGSLRRAAGRRRCRTGRSARSASGSGWAATPRPMCRP